MRSMKKISFFLLLFCGIYLSWDEAFAQEVVKAAFPLTESLKINKSVENESFELEVPNSLNRTNAVAVSGKVKFLSPLGLLSVIAKSKSGEEYLIYQHLGAFATMNRWISFDEVCFETALLWSVDIDKIRIVATDCEAIIDNLSNNQDDAVVTMAPALKIQLTQSFNQVRVEQIRRTILKINEFNMEKGVPWRAGETSLSFLTFSEKKAVFGSEDFYLNNIGIEHYSSGIYVHFPLLESCRNIKFLDSGTGRYVPEFSWQNQHGVNWDSPHKHQQSSSTCWAFAVLANLESRINLLANRRKNYDLSEQELISCCWGPEVLPADSLDFEHPSSGYYTSSAGRYVVDNGIRTEESFPFEAKYVPCSRKNDDVGSLVQPQSYKRASFMGSTENIIQSIIKNGPFVASYSGVKWGTSLNDSARYSAHAMNLVGYGVIKPGPWIVDWLGEPIIIPEDSPFVGKVYWICKNSYGEDFSNRGYSYILRYSAEDLKGHSLYADFYLEQFSGDVFVDGVKEEPIVTDEDQDGLLFWGIGDRPKDLPPCFPQVKDGDDSNPDKGEMNEYGYFVTASSAPPREILHNETISNHLTMQNDYVIRSGATLTIKGGVHFSNRKRIYVNANSSLVIDGGAIVNASVVVYPGGELVIKNNGSVVKGHYSSIEIQKGAVMNLLEGQVVEIQDLLNDYNNKRSRVL